MSTFRDRADVGMTLQHLFSEGFFDLHHKNLGRSGGRVRAEKSCTGGPSPPLEWLWKAPQVFRAGSFRSSSARFGALLNLVYLLYSMLTGCKNGSQTTQVPEVKLAAFCWQSQALPWRRVSGQVPVHTFGSCAQRSGVVHMLCMLCITTFECWRSSTRSMHLVSYTAAHPVGIQRRRQGLAQCPACGYPGLAAIANLSELAWWGYCCIKLQNADLSRVYASLILFIWVGSGHET